MSYYNDDIGAYYAERDYLEREDPEFLEKYEYETFEDFDALDYYYDWEEY